MADLSPEEVTDLFLTVHKVGPALERYFSGDALNIAVQDGKASGQSVPHVHVHILPRKNGDYDRNDDIYEALDQHEAKIDFHGERVTRSLEQMAEEASQLRLLFES
ncbi:FHIT [Symbiodinium microadriaticum]|nr:FHIT [Symbiodinium microadriaticum]